MPLCGIDDDNAADSLLALFGLSGGCVALKKVFDCNEDTRASQLGYASIAHMCPNVCDACAPSKCTYFGCKLNASHNYLSSIIYFLLLKLRVMTQFTGNFLTLKRE